MTSRVKRALDELDGSVEIIYDIDECRDFVEVRGDIGGDVVRYRVYFDENDNVDYVCAK